VNDFNRHEEREGPSAATPATKKSEYLPQRRKGRKGRRRNRNGFLQEVTEIKEMNQNTSFPLFSPVKRSFFAFLASWRDQKNQDQQTAQKDLRGEAHEDR